MLRINIRAAATYFSSCCKKVTQIHPHLFTAGRNQELKRVFFLTVPAWSQLNYQRTRW